MEVGLLALLAVLQMEGRIATRMKRVKTMESYLLIPCQTIFLRRLPVSFFFFERTTKGVRSSVRPNAAIRLTGMDRISERRVMEPVK